ncbi:alpha/beta fold hydrolase [Mucilaginibacter ginsenosidivorax]|uniref:Alpha/beta hydrolase n=1 Tax=Mucilaginibacter ginsenosidivorax TaxID=862126 RepID=A0A5B8W4V6_9SPHI|nr:alpha/beta hydrolase [Mucilaginibacter ginsenosidivorax]QEC79090.1 alpha/beta hydrolase [Mucilaginibacter ginsenosidivorax]
MPFRKLSLTLFLSVFFVPISYSQQKQLPYGDNASVGKYYNIRGIKLYTETYGSGKPLLMIHGNGDKMSAFKNNIPYFAKKYKVIAVDSRAHGKSTDAADSLSFEQMADDFAALLDAMHIESAYVIGWSDGGINALELAMRHPEKVIKLASTGANLWPDSTGLIPSLWKDMQKNYAAHKNEAWKTAKEKNDWKIFMLDYDQPHIKLTELHKIKCPSFIIGGDHDLIPVEHTVIIAQNIPKSYLWIVPNSGHPTLQEHADDFNKLVDDFFEKPFNKR